MTSTTGDHKPPMIVGSGTAALDSVETPSGPSHRQVGGSAIYFAAAAGALTQVSVVGVIGDDYPVDDLAFLEGAGTDMRGLQCVAGTSMSWHAQYGKDLSERRTISSDPGVSATVPPLVPPHARAAPLVFLGSQRPMSQAAVLGQMTSLPIVALDTMMHWVKDAGVGLAALVERCHVLFINEAEVKALCGLDRVETAAAELLQRGPGVVVVKRGRDGAMAFGPGFTLDVPAWPVPRVVDPTGAGDAFAGGFMGVLALRTGLSSDTVAAGLRYGSAAGSLAVEAFGVSGFATMERSEIADRAQALEVTG